PCNIGRYRATAPGNAIWRGMHWRKPKLKLRSMISSMRMVKAAAGSYSTRGGERTMSWESALPHAVPVTSSASHGARASPPGLPGAIPGAWAIAEALASARKPLDIQFTTTEAGLDVDLRGPGPLTAAQSAALAEVAARHRLVRLTRHGELIAQYAAPILPI